MSLMCSVLCVSVMCLYLSVISRTDKQDIRIYVYNYPNPSGTLCCITSSLCGHITIWLHALLQGHSLCRSYIYIGFFLSANYLQ